MAAAIQPNMSVAAQPYINSAGKTSTTNTTTASMPILAQHLQPSAVASSVVLSDATSASASPSTASSIKQHQPIVATTANVLATATGAGTAASSIPTLSASPLLLRSMDSSSYRDAIEFSANFNRRLTTERRLRLPFLDPQTGVAQNHSALFRNRRQRMPGFREGQLYSYPAARWRKSRRQYLAGICTMGYGGGGYGLPGAADRLASTVSMSSVAALMGGGRPFGSVGSGSSSGKSLTATASSSPFASLAGAAAVQGSPSTAAATTAKRHAIHAAMSIGDASNASLASGGDATDSNDYSGPGTGGGGGDLHSDSAATAAAADDSKDSCGGGGGAGGANSSSSLKDDLPKEWFYDDMDMHEIDALDEPKSPADDEYDYDPRYGHKKKRKRRPAATATSRRSGGGGGGGLDGEQRASGTGRGKGRGSAAAAATGSATTASRGDGFGGIGIGGAAASCSTAGTAAAGGGTAGSTTKGRGRGRKSTKGSMSRAEKAALAAEKAAAAASGGADRLSPSHAEPPSFEMAAAAMHGVDDGSYRKYL